VADKTAPEDGDVVDDGGAAWQAAYDAAEGRETTSPKIAREEPTRAPLPATETCPDCLKETGLLISMCEPCFDRKMAGREARLLAKLASETAKAGVAKALGSETTCTCTDEDLQTSDRPTSGCPVHDWEHWTTCGNCGERFDMRDLDAVMLHEHAGLCEELGPTGVKGVRREDSPAQVQVADSATQASRLTRSIAMTDTAWQTPTKLISDWITQVVALLEAEPTLMDTAFQRGKNHLLDQAPTILAALRGPPQITPSGRFTPREEALIASLTRFTTIYPDLPMCGRAWRAGFASGEMWANATKGGDDDEQ